jgi:hypothetical protein
MKKVAILSNVFRAAASKTGLPHGPKGQKNMPLLSFGLFFGFRFSCLPMVH